MVLRVEEFWLERDCALELGDRVGRVSLQSQNEAEQVVRDRGVGIQRERLVTLRVGCVELMTLEKGPCL